MTALIPTAVNHSSGTPVSSTLYFTAEALRNWDIAYEICLTIAASRLWERPVRSWGTRARKLHNLSVLACLSKTHPLSLVARRGIFSVQRSAMPVISTLPLDFKLYGEASPDFRRVPTWEDTTKLAIPLLLEHSTHPRTLFGMTRSFTFTFDYDSNLGLPIPPDVRSALQSILITNQSLMPGLLHLTWKITDRAVALRWTRYLPLFLGRNLQSIELKLYDHVSYLALLGEGLAPVYLSLERVVLEGDALRTAPWRDEAIPDFLSRLPNLRKFKQVQEGAAIGSKTLALLSQAAKLDEVSLRGVHRQSITSIAEGLSRYTEIFVGLQRLELLDTELDVATIILNFMPPTQRSNLRSFKVARAHWSPKYWIAQPTEYLTLLHALYGHAWRGMLEEISINVNTKTPKWLLGFQDSDFPIDMDKYLLSIAGLLGGSPEYGRYLCLQTLEISAAYGVRLSDEEVARIATTCPQLQTLHLNADPLVDHLEDYHFSHKPAAHLPRLMGNKSFSVPTIRSLFHLAKYCRQLHHASLPVDTTVVSDDDLRLAEQIMQPNVTVLCLALDPPRDRTTRKRVENVMAAVFPSLRRIAPVSWFKVTRAAGRLAGKWRKFPGKAYVERTGPYEASYASGSATTRPWSADLSQDSE
ncbi:hypothetical protein C8F01DRAFT_162218 [Mycena amicta]|nr:hypothetical protein C8F01DRAFT_162218 [Mycena amicta]